MPQSQTTMNDRQHSLIRRAAKIEGMPIYQYLAIGASRDAERVIAADKERAKEARERRS